MCRQRQRAHAEQAELRQLQRRLHHHVQRVRADAPREIVIAAGGEQAVLVQLQLGQPAAETVLRALVADVAAEAGRRRAQFAEAGADGGDQDLAVAARLGGVDGDLQRFALRQQRGQVQLQLAAGVDADLAQLFAAADGGGAELRNVDLVVVAGERRG
ncbi:hypothetical protein D3C72_1707260 [compost metagenome]